MHPDSLRANTATPGAPNWKIWRNVHSISADLDRANIRRSGGTPGPGLRPGHRPHWPGKL